jgi:hypothetical protein
MDEHVSGAQMLQLFQHQHHESGLNPHMEQFILDHDWVLKQVTPDQIPDYDHEVHYNDPFGRIIDFDEDRIRWWRNRMRAHMHVPPLILGPDHAIIDGNHRAQAARTLGIPMMAYVPMKPEGLMMEHMMNKFRTWAGII